MTSGPAAAVIGSNDGVMAEPELPVTGPWMKVIVEAVYDVEGWRGA